MTKALIAITALIVAVVIFGDREPNAQGQTEKDRTAGRVPTLGSFNAVISSERFVGWPPSYQLNPDPAQNRGSMRAWLKQQEQRNEEEASRLQWANTSNGPMRAGAVLVLPLMSNRYLKLFDEGICGGNESCLLHSYQFFDEKAGCYFVKIDQGEGTFWIAIAFSTGVIAQMADRPIFTSDKVRAAAYVGDPFLGPALTIVRFGKDGPIQEFSAGLEDGLPIGGNFQWVDNSRIVVGGSTEADSFVLVLTDGFWRRQKPVVK